MEKLLEKLFGEEIKLSLLLLEAKPLAEAANDEALIELIKNESDGYTSSQDLPDYRKLRGQIIGDIQDQYGQIHFQGKELDFSVLSDHIGFDLNQVPIPDSVGFIEDVLKQISGSLAARAIPPQLVKMLNQTFKHNNPQLKIASASHQIGTASLQFILTKVRQELIVGLQRLAQNKTQSIEILGEDLIEPKTVFVTYAWGEAEHNDKVISFVNFLRKKGYDASMDRKFSQAETAINFNKMMVEGIQNSEKVVVVLNPNYKVKADKFEGGVGVEIQLILEEIKTNPNKFIFVSFGKNELREITPTSIAGREVLDLKKDQDQNGFNNLFAKLESKNIIHFSEVNKSKQQIIQTNIKPFEL